MLLTIVLCCSVIVRAEQQRRPRQTGPKHSGNEDVAIGVELVICSCCWNLHTSTRRGTLCRQRIGSYAPLPGTSCGCPCNPFSHCKRHSWWAWAFPLQLDLQWVSSRLWLVLPTLSQDRYWHKQSVWWANTRIVPKTSNRHLAHKPVDNGVANETQAGILSPQPLRQTNWTGDHKKV